MDHRYLQNIVRSTSDSGSFWRAIRTRTRPILGRIADNSQISSGLFAEVVSKCDPSTARLGEGFFDDEYKTLLDHKMMELLRDARVTWM
jgi:hypothetical protein